MDTAAVRLADAAPDEHAAVRVLTDVVGSRHTIPTRLSDAVGRCSRLARRRFLLEVLEDIELGTHSVLERGYLHRVERAHGLPPSRRQVRDTAGGKTVYRDTMVGSLVVELDGRTHHEGAVARHRDLQRDLVAAVSGLQTVRLGWGQVFGDPCATARSVGHLLRTRGWTGAVGSCPDCS